MRTLTETEFAAAIEEFYIESEDDVVGLWEVTKVVEDTTGDSDVTDESLRIVAALLEMGLEASRSPYEGNSYEAWPEQDTATVLSRIRKEWMERGEAPNITDSPWFARRVGSGG